MRGKKIIYTGDLRKGSLEFLDFLGTPIPSPPKINYCYQRFQKHLDVQRLQLQNFKQKFQTRLSIIVWNLWTYHENM